MYKKLNLKYKTLKTIGNIIAPTVLPIATVFFEANKPIKKNIIVIIKLIGASINIVPALVATPFPPLKPKNIENTCPIIAATAHIIKILFCPFNINEGIKTAIIPFPISQKYARIPAFFPHNLKTLLAPGFALPSFLTSCPFAFPIINEKGIAPIK